VGKAHKAPPSTYQRQFIITGHALQRFRERVEKEFAARSDFDLGNLLDERIRTCGKCQTVEDLRNIDAETRVFEIESRAGDVYYAVVRDDTVVTVLDRRMLEVNFENGSWKRGPMNTPFAKLTLRGLVREESAIKPPTSLPTPLPSVAHVEPDIVAAASMRVGAAMVAHTQAQQRIVKLERQLKDAQLARDAAADEVTAAQFALAEAVEKTAQEDQ
jgi:hypothetical protein